MVVVKTQLASKKKFLSSRKCVEPDFLFGAKIQTAISPLAETGATRSIRLVSVQCKEREKMTFLVRFFFFESFFLGATPTSGGLEFFVTPVSAKTETQ